MAINSTSFDLSSRLPTMGAEGSLLVKRFLHPRPKLLWGRGVEMTKGEVGSLIILNYCLLPCVFM